MDDNLELGNFNELKVRSSKIPSYSRDELYLEFEAEYKKLAEELDITPQRAIIILINSGKSLNGLIDDWKHSTVQKAIRENLDLTLTFSNLSVEEKSCTICFNDGSNLFRSLLCGHDFCADCWKNYVVEAISQNNCSIYCPGSEPDGQQCTYVMTIDQIKEALDDDLGKYFDKYRNILLDNFITRSSLVHNCPKCQNYVKITSDLPLVRCKCSHSFCPQCKNPPHEPVRCALVAEVLKGSQIIDEGNLESMRYIVNQTRYCPRCKTPVQKTDGCKFMQCLCKAYFCYDCLKRLTTAHEGHTCRTGAWTHVSENELTALEKESNEFVETKRKFTASNAEVDVILSDQEKAEIAAENLKRLYNSNISSEEADLLKRCVYAQHDLFSFLAHACLWVQFVSKQGALDDFYIQDCQRVFSDFKKKFRDILSQVTVSRSWVPEVRNGTILLEKQLDTLRSHFKNNN